MKLIADSGSTKTHWCITDGSKILKQVFTSGINPYYQTEAEIRLIVEEELLSETGILFPEEVFFYGAGCAFPEKKAVIFNSLKPYFKNASILIENDLLAACRSLFYKEEGIACILGTGSNSCLYDGNKIVRNVSPLGFILGDEGSGAILGKRLIADALKGQLPEGLKAELLGRFELTPELILDKVYKKPFPNRFLAGFSVFLLENIQEPAIYHIVSDEFDRFIKRNIMQYPYEGKKVGFVGSIAFHFSGILRDVAQQKNIIISKIIRQPMEGLINFHAK